MKAAGLVAHIFIAFTCVPVAWASSMCSWCEAGDDTCDWTYSDYSQDTFVTSVSASIGGRAFPYFRPSAQKSLGIENSNAKLAIIVHHGAGRNGEDYTSYMTNAVVRSGLSLDETIVIGPQVYEAGDDGLDESIHIWWEASSDDGLDDEVGERDWKWGGNSTLDLPASISTFSVLDEMLMTLSNKDLYPNLQRVVFAGHSAGGQIMQRYALFSRTGSEVAGIPVSYFVGNPSSVTYLGPERPIQLSTKDCGNFCVNSTISNQVWSFAIPNSSQAEPFTCADTYNQYGYGLDGDLPDYPMTTTIPVALSNYEGRDVTYLSGSSDVCDAPFMTENNCEDGTCEPDDGGLDTSCEGEQQGWCRMARLHAFAQYVQLFYGEGKAVNHKLTEVPYVGHSGCGMFQSEQFASAALYPPIQTNTPKTKAVLQRVKVSVGDFSYSCLSDSTQNGCDESDPLQGQRNTGSGSVLMGGGTDVDAAFQWQIDHAGGGDFLVLRESGTDAYDEYIWDLANGDGSTRLRSVATLILNSRTAGGDDRVLEYVRNADAIFFAGGDQSRYVDFIAGTALDALLKGKAPAITIGGTSAGNAIQGPWIYTGAKGSAVSTTAMLDPYLPTINGCLVDGLLNVPSLDAQQVVTDDHFVTRDRMGRMVVFMARIGADGYAGSINQNTTIRSVGVDEVTALLLDASTNTITTVGEGTAYMCTATPESLLGMECMQKTPLTISGILCERLTAAGFDNYTDPTADTFNVDAWSGSGVKYGFDIVNGVIVGDAYGP